MKKIFENLIPEKHGITYVAGAYTHEHNSVMAIRALYLTKVTAQLISESFVPYSPITHGHFTVTNFPEFDIPRNFEFWKNQCMPMLTASSRLLVVKYDGWLESTGLQEEINQAKLMNIDVYEVDFNKNFRDGWLC